MTSAMFPERKPYPSEYTHFLNNPKVAGMATEDNKIIINPYSKLSDAEKNGVRTNESARLFMRKNKIPLDFELTEKQRKVFSKYSQNEDDIKATIVGRILSGDKSAIDPTPEQHEYASNIKMKMLLGQHKDKDFVKRILGYKGRDKSPVLDLSNIEEGKYGTYGTHLMSGSTVDGKTMAYPRIINTGKGLKLLSEQEALQHAMKTGEYIPFQSIDDVNWFGQNYKKASPYGGNW